MFFVGATGQLITLLLTVCIPLVFLVSGHQKIELTKNINSLKIVHIKVNIDQVTDDTVTCDQYDIADNHKNKFFADFSPPNKVLFKKTLVKKPAHYSIYGNKAPPIIA